MFKLKYAGTCDNEIFTINHIKPVVEDYYKVDQNVFCVADGVTRDLKDATVAVYPKNREEVLNWIEKYPNPSGAFEAAKITCDNFVERVNEDKENINEMIIKEKINKVNQEVWKINEKREIDYIVEDLYCCVAVGGIIQENYLYAFSIGDCHISILDKDFNILFTTKNNHKQFENFIDQIYVKEHTYNWNNPQDRKMVRKEYRNKPNKKWEGNDISFGVISGEKEAEYYIDSYKIDVTEAKYICAYSDGCEPDFESKEIYI